MFKTIKEVAKAKFKLIYLRGPKGVTGAVEKSFLQRFDKVNGKWFFRKIKIVNSLQGRRVLIKREPLKFWALKNTFLSLSIIVLVWLLVHVSGR